LIPLLIKASSEKTMKLFDFLKLLTKEKFPFKIEYLDWCENIKVSVDTFSKTEVYEFKEEGLVEYSELVQTLTIEEPDFMTAKVQNLIDRPLNTWVQAAADLGIKFISPYPFTGIDNRVYEATGLLPEFGHGKGVLIVTRRDDEDTVTTMAELVNDYFLTSLNPASYDTYNRARIIETLSDWGWIGAGEKPDWLLPQE
jgi:hypothetical protein